MLPLFILSEWELPAGSSLARSAPATARISAHFRGKEQMVLARLLEFGGEFSVTLVRGEQETDEASWTPLRAFDAQEMPWPLSQPLEEWDDAIAQSDYGRIVWFEGAMAVLHPDGRANWRIPKNREEVPFRWHDGPRDWLPVPADEWKAALELEFQNPESDASFAYRWALLSEKQRREIVWECDEGWDDFHNLLRWMLTAQSDLEPEQSYAIRVLCLNYGRDYFGLEFWFEEWENDGYVDKRVEWIVDWENLINELFSIHARRELIECHRCAKAQFPLNMGNAFLVERGPISFHEKVEALLHLNEWARPRGIQMLSSETERFDLEEWELMPLAPETREGFATVCVHSRWLGEEQEFLLRQVKMASDWYVIFARPRDGSWPGHFALCASGDEDDQPFTARSWKRTELAPLWGALIEHALLARVFFLDLSRWGGGGYGCITLHANGKGCLDHQGNEAIFEWRADDLEHAPVRDWLVRLEEELGNRRSDACFALSWARLEDEERVNRLFWCQRGTIEELRDVLRLAMRCELSFVRKSTSLKFPRPDQRQWHWNLWPVERLAELHSPTDHPVSTHLKRWGEAIVGWFSPTFDEELRHAHRCVFEFYHLHQERLLDVSVTALTPTEQDEAKQLLCEWARGKVPDELLATLL
ncbi:hypothetical protein IAD21_02396 [Abditibacteriota bacterium]|nr:hypothetical protein IAD21_02396 [Abditibacteriota bacterium]